MTGTPSAYLCRRTLRHSRATDRGGCDRRKRKMRRRLQRSDCGHNRRPKPRFGFWRRLRIPTVRRAAIGFGTKSFRIGFGRRSFRSRCIRPPNRTTTTNGANGGALCVLPLSARRARSAFRSCRAARRLVDLQPVLGLGCRSWSASNRPKGSPQRRISRAFSSPLSGQNAVKRASFPRRSWAGKRARPACLIGIANYSRNSENSLRTML